MGLPVWFWWGEEQVRCRLKASISVFRILYQNDHLVSWTHVLTWVFFNWTKRSSSHRWQTLFEHSGAPTMDEYVMKMNNRLRDNVSRCPSSRQLFFGNLCTVTVDELRAYCEQYGAVGDFSINRDKDQNVRWPHHPQSSFLRISLLDLPLLCLYHIQIFSLGVPVHEQTSPLHQWWSHFR